MSVLSLRVSLLPAEPLPFECLPVGIKLVPKFLVYAYQLTENESDLLNFRRLFRLHLPFVQRDKRDVQGSILMVLQNMSVQ